MYIYNLCIAKQKNSRKSSTKREIELVDTYSKISVISITELFPRKHNRNIVNN